MASVDPQRTFIIHETFLTVLYNGKRQILLIFTLRKIGYWKMIVLWH